MKNMKIEVILFDLDDTLYPDTSGIWALIRERIDLFMIEKVGYKPENVHEARENFFRQFGTTLRGLESTHHIDPIQYLNFVHDIPLINYLLPNSQLDKMLSSISIKKVIFTNGDRWHARRVTDTLKITQHFTEVIDVIDVNPFCKPMIESFQIALSKLGISDPKKVLLVDDNLKNIQMGQSIGLETVLISSKYKSQDNGIRHIEKVENLLDVFPELAKNMEV